MSHKIYKHNKGRKALTLSLITTSIVLATSSLVVKNNPNHQTSFKWPFITQAIGFGQTVSKVYYVDQSKGNDSYAGTTQAQPFKSINRANQVVAAGDVVYVKNGTYEENITIKASGQANKWIVFKAFPGHRPYVKGNQDGVFKVEGNYIEVNGFEVTSTDTGSGIHVGNNNHHTRIFSNRIHDSGCGGISGMHTDYLHIEGNVTYRNAFRSRYQCSGISIYQAKNFDHKPGFHNIIRRNISYSNQNLVPSWGNQYTDGNGIIIDDFRHSQSNPPAPKYTGATLIENNIVFDNGGRGIHVFYSDNVVVRNNTSYMNLKDDRIDGHLKGELTTYFSGNIQFYNNVAYARNASTLTFVDDYSQGNKWDYNLSYNGKTLVNDGHSDVVLGKNNKVGVDPKFIKPSVDPSQANFRLQVTSGAIDVGTATSAASKDFDNKNRPSGGKYDVGAFEYIKK